MYTSLGASVALPLATWTNVLSLNLDPGIWIIIGGMLVSSATQPCTVELRIQDFGGTDYGGAQALTVNAYDFGPPRLAAAQIPILAVADLSANVLPENVRLDARPTDTIGGTTAVTALAATPLNTVPGATWLMAFVDAQAILQEIHDAVYRTFPV